MADCLFCKIVNGDIPSAKIYEDEHVFAFLDIAQLTKGHTLIIPKKHYENMYDLSEEAAEQMFRVVPKIANALKSELQPLGMNLVSNTGKAAGQQVFHIHLHLIPRYGEEDGFKPVITSHQDDYTQEDLQNIAAQVRNGL